MNRVKLFHRQVERLQRRLDHCAKIDNYYSLARLVIFLVGAAGAWAVGAIWGPAVGGIIALVFLFVFTVVVLLHRRLDSWTNAFRIWQGLYREKVARLELDWKEIPAPAFSSSTLSPLALDLDLLGQHSLHHLLDATLSSQGSQLLADWLTESHPDVKEISKRQAVVRELADMPRFRNRLMLLFRRLSREPLDDENLLGWLKKELNEKRLRLVLPLAIVLTLINLVIAFFVLVTPHLLPPWWLLSVLVYAWVYFANQRIIADFLDAIVFLDRELDKFQPLLRFLEEFLYQKKPALKQQCSLFLSGPYPPSKRLRRVKLVTALAGLRSNPMVGTLLNILFPWDFLVAWLAARQRRSMSEVLPIWLAKFHELESLISLGEFAALHPEYSFPDISPRSREKQPVFSATALGHPLLPSSKKVCNDLKVDELGQLWIITGSNMAGKSTFLRTVGVNLCLAYAGGPVNAASLHSLPFKLYTCIRISDSLGDGYSYFYAEVKRLKGLLDSLEKSTVDEPLLYLVDEIFRGTNNRERLLGSRAFVKALVGKAGVGLIATHDLELASLAEGQGKMYNVHFCDAVQDGKLVFDYLLRPGSSPTTNALKIMAMEGLPVEMEKKNRRG